MTAPAIAISDLGKVYLRGTRDSTTPHLRDAFRAVLASPLKTLLGTHSDSDRFWALRNVNLAVQPGEVLGIIGRNGAGKSTLLKLISRITPPTEGSIRLHGRVASLLEVGTGFHPEFTGRENIFVNGAILGMRREEIRQKFDEIVSFAGIGEFLDTPVKRYSSGMYVRLAFAVAAFLEPEILLVDEVLAVGDLAFQRKCLGRMREVSRSEGRTVLFVSHNMHAIRELCTRVIVVSDGHIVRDAATDDAVSCFIEESLSHARTGSLDLFRLYRLRDNAPAYFTSVRARSSQRSESAMATFDFGEEAVLDLEVLVRSAVPDVKVTIDIARTTGERATVISTQDSGFTVNLAPPGARLTCRIPKLPFTIGTYQISIGLNIAPGLAGSMDYIKDLPLFEVAHVPAARGTFANRSWGIVHLDDVTWELSATSPNPTSVSGDTSCS